VWSIGMTGLLATDRAIMAVADGYLTLSGRDGYMYTFGKGLSEITISAPQIAVSSGQKVLLTGSILDLSPAQPGAPCVAKESMAAQMEHIHLQVGVGGVFDNVPMIGVDVMLYANGVYIGTVKSDGYSGTFAFEWVPEDSGLYTITAEFVGDDSYGKSSATTYLTVVESSDNGTNNTLLYAVIVATIAIIVAMVLCFLIFRKK